MTAPTHQHVEFNTAKAREDPSHLCVLYVSMTNLCVSSGQRPFVFVPDQETGEMRKC